MMAGIVRMLPINQNTMLRKKSPSSILTRPVNSAEVPSVLVRRNTPIPNTIAMIPKMMALAPSIISFSMAL